MKHLEEIITWLEAGTAADYRAGVLLLQAHSGNRSLVNTLLKKESAAHREKLTYELVKVVTGGRLEEVGEVMSHFAAVVSEAMQGAVQKAVEPLAEQPAPVLEELSAEARTAVEELTVRMQSAYNRRCQLSNSLAGLPEGDGPRVVAEILQLQAEYNDLSAQRQRLQAGEPVLVERPASAEASAPVADRATLIQQRGNLRSQVSKARKAAEAKPDDQLRAEKLAKLLAHLEEVEMQLKQLPGAAPTA